MRGPGQWQRRSPRLAVAVALCLLAGCGSSGTDPADLAAATLVTSAQPPAAAAWSGRILPAAAGVVMAEIDDQGRELQRASPSDDSGRFRFARAPRGAFVQAVIERNGVPLAPVHAALLAAQLDEIEVTPQSTYVAHLVAGGLRPGQARALAASVLAEQCGDEARSAVQSETGAATPAWLSSALHAHLVALQSIGSPLGASGNAWWDDVLRQRGLLAQMCSLAREVHDAGFAEQLRTQAQGALGRALRPAEAAALPAAQGLAAESALALLGTLAPWRHYPELAPLLDAEVATWRGRERTLAQQVALAALVERASETTAQRVTLVTLRSTPMLNARGALRWSLNAVAVDDAKSAGVVRLVNTAASERSMTLSFNGQALSDFRGVLDSVLALPKRHANEALQMRAFRYVVARHRHDWPLSVGRFQHQPELYLRSLGVGLCDDAATSLRWIWEGLGYKARVVGLEGHVVAEVQVDGRWEMYDPDYGAYYLTRDMRVASVADLEADPTLVTLPTARTQGLAVSPYSDLLATLYASTADNSEVDFFKPAPPEPLGHVFTLPPGAHLTVANRADADLPSMEPGFNARFVPVRLWLPPGWSGSLDLPLVLGNLEGDATVSLLGATLTVTPRGLLSWLTAYYRTGPDVGVQRVQVSQVGAGGLTLTLLASSSLLNRTPTLAVRAESNDLSGVVVDRTGSANR